MAASQQQAGSAPEDVWIPFIQSIYPDLLQTTHFFPPLFFNQVPHIVKTVAGQTALVRQNPPPPPPTRGRSRKQRRVGSYPPQSSTSSQSSTSPQPSTSSQPSASSQPSILSQSSPAGRVFTVNPSGLQDKHNQGTDRQNDEAQYQCLQALRGIKEVMMVISQMMFRKYLDNQNNPQHHINLTSIIISQLPSVIHPSISPSVADGECDIIIIHRQYGILVGEVKSVGGGQWFSTQSPADQNKSIAKVVPKAIKQLDNQELALKHLVHDMAGGNIRVTKALLLPNITSAQLTAAVNSSQQLPVDLCRSTHTQGVTQAVSRCLCADQLPQPSTWWSALTTGGPDPSMTDRLYERLAARFCGPAITVDIPTAGHPPKVLRTFGEAVAETALRFSSLVLTPDQVDLLNMLPEPQYLYLQGPPGTGKTVVLVLKALQWARRGKRVIVVSQSDNIAVTILVEEQLARMLGTAAAAPAGSIHRHSCDLCNVKMDVSHLMQLLGPGPDPEAFILFDEAPKDSDGFIRWLTEVRHRLPSVHVWAASLRRVNRDPLHTPPAWLEIREVTEPLRSPPAVTSQVEGTGQIDGHNIPRYSTPALPPPTEGPPVRKLSHDGQAGHSGRRPWECALCADTIGHLLIQELQVGQPGAPQFKDTWVLCHRLPDASHADVLVHGLRGRHGIHVSAVPRPPTSDSDTRNLALGLTDQVIVTDCYNVQGLERAVVIALGGEGVGVHYRSFSRSTSFLCIIR